MSTNLENVCVVYLLIFTLKSSMGNFANRVIIQDAILDRYGSFGAQRLGI